MNYFKITLFLLFFFSNHVNAETFTVDGINYILSKDYRNETVALVVSPTDNQFAGDIVIPAQVTYAEKKYEVIGVYYYGTFSSDKLTSLTLLSPRFDFGSRWDWYLDGCPNLKAINISENHEYLKSVDGVVMTTNRDNNSLIYMPRGYRGNFTVPDGVDNISEYACKNCSGLVNVIMSNTVKGIGQYAFQGCENLSSIQLSNSLQLIARYAFGGCKSLTEVRIPGSLITFAGNAFYGCENLTKFSMTEDSAFFAVDGVLYKKSQYYIGNGYTDGIGLVAVPNGRTGAFIVPEGTIAVQEGAFDGCSKLTSVEIPTSVKSIGGTFRDCLLNPLVIHTPGEFIKNSINIVSDLNPLSTVYISSKISSNLNYFGTIIPIDLPFGIKVIQYYRALQLSIENNPYYTGSTAKLLKFIFSERELPIDNSSSYISGLRWYSLCNVKIEYSIGNSNMTYKQKLKTKEWEPGFGSCIATQTTLSASGFRVPTDESSILQEFGLRLVGPNGKTDYPITEAYDVIDFQFNGKVYPGTAVFNGSLKAESLIPGTRYEKYIYAKYSDGEDIIHFKGYDLPKDNSWHDDYVYTKGLNPTVTNQSISSTTFSGTCSYNEEDAHVSETELYFNNTKLEGEGKDFYIHGLDPNKSYALRYVVKTEEGSTEEYKTTITTPALELATQAVKVPNKGEAIVCATTNIADDETGVGFEWRKTDAPDVVASKSGDAVVFQGAMEGKIKNLDASTYWKARPFYKSASGNMYYGDWTGFDPSDFSYFEPTVYTYQTVQVNGTSATISGCSVEGSDEITNQGFEYWIGTADARGTNRSQTSDVKRVSVDGQRMTTTLTGLQTGTTYCYRCYVMTNKGTTYGEVRTFTTPGDSDYHSDIKNTIADSLSGSSDVYNLHGVKVRSHTTSLEGLPKGLYIVNGKKILLK